MRRLLVTFDGRVQGVGFRFTTVRLAASFAVSGYVRNNSDGSVTVLAEGEEQELGRFLNAVRTSSVSRYISAMKVEWLAATGEYDGFDVTYGE